MALWTLMFIHLVLGMLDIETDIVITYLAFLLMLLQGSVNPIIYYFGLHVFEQAFKNIMERNIKKCNKVQLPAEDYIPEITQDSQFRIIAKRTFTVFSDCTRKYYIK